MSTTEDTVARVPSKMQRRDQTINGILAYFATNAIKELVLHYQDTLGPTTFSPQSAASFIRRVAIQAGMRDDAPEPEEPDVIATMHEPEEEERTLVDAGAGRPEEPYLPADDPVSWQRHAQERTIATRLADQNIAGAVLTYESPIRIRTSDPIDIKQRSLTQDELARLVRQMYEAAASDWDQPQEEELGPRTGWRCQLCSTEVSLPMDVQPPECSCGALAWIYERGARPDLGVIMTNALSGAFRWMRTLNPEQQTNAMLHLVRKERERQREIYGTDDTNELATWITILTTELGEVGQNVLNYRQHQFRLAALYEGEDEPADEDVAAERRAMRAERDQIKEETVHVAAVAVALLEQIARQEREEARQ